LQFRAEPREASQGLPARSLKPGNSRGVVLKIAGPLALAILFAVLPRLAAADTVAPAPPDDAQSSDATLLPQLRGLRFVDDPAKMKDAGALHPGVYVNGSHLLYGAANQLRIRALIGQPFLRSTMNRITQSIAAWYRAHHRPFVDVTFPEQDINAGIVQVIVTEFRLGHLRVQGNKWFSSRLLASYVRVAPGDRIDMGKLDTDLAALNRNPYRRIRIVAQKSDIQGATDLVLQTDDRLPWHLFTGYSNGGVPVLGRNNWSIGFDWGNVFGLDQDLSYQFISSDDFWFSPTHVTVGPNRASLAEHILSYTIPLPWEDRLIIFGNIAELEPRIGPFFSQVGVSWQASARYDIDLSDTDTLTQDLQFGFDFKRTNNNLAFGGFAVSQSSTEIDQFPIIYDAALDDELGKTVLLGQIVFSPGGLTGRNNDAAFQPSLTQVGVPFAHADYVYADLNLTRLTRLPFDASWLFRLQSQFSTSNLLASEELGAGGVETVRGYDERTLNGPLGVLVSSEFRSPPWPVLDSLFGTRIGDKFQADLFWDFGYVSQEKFIAGVQNDAAIQSVGAGAHYAIDRFLDLRFEYGQQLRRAPGATSRGGEAFFSAVVGY
jgi:hemolysin activation/secretion protein